MSTEISELAILSRDRILLYGPKISRTNAISNGGEGGVSRNMALLLNDFRSDRFEIQPCFHSVRRKSNLHLPYFVGRLFLDTIRVIGPRRGSVGIHVFGQYRMAVYREFCVALVCKLMGLPLLYQIRAGAFIDWFNNCPYPMRKMMTFVIKIAKVVLCEGEPYLPFLQARMGKKGHYFPNFVPTHEIPDRVEPKLQGPTLKVLFVGAVNEEKGAFALVKACEVCIRKELPVRLTLVGEESDRFRNWADEYQARFPAGQFRRVGSIDHESVLSFYSSHDIFCLPTQYLGEGHTNAINEAMMMGLIIVSTCHGFLRSALGEDCSYFLDDRRPETIANTFLRIDQARDEALKKAVNARARVRERYSSRVAFEKLEKHYGELTGKSTF